MNSATELAAKQAAAKRYHKSIEIPDRFLNDIVYLASEACEDAAAYITIADGDRVEVIASRTPRSQEEDPIAVKIFARLPITTGTGIVIGTLSVADHEITKLTYRQQSTLKRLANMAVAHFETKLKAFIAASTAVSEHSRAEEITEVHEQFKDSVLENLSDGVMACNAKGELTLLNKALRSFHGIDERTDIPLEQFTEYFGLHHADGKTLLAFDEIPLVRALRGEIVKDFDIVIVNHDGTRRIIRTNGRAMYDKEGTLLGAVVAMRDRTEAATIYSQLEASKRTLEYLIETSPAGVIVFDREMRISLWNSGCEKMFGWTKEESIGVSLVDSNDSASVATRKSLENLRDSRGRLEVEERRFCKDGSFITVKASVVPVIDEKDEVAGYLSVMVDISDLVKKEADLLAINHALKVAAEAKSRFLAKMSHELCTPLNHVIGMSEFVLESKLDLEQRKFIDEINQSGENLLTMVNQILEFSRVDAGEIKIEKTNFSFSDIAESVQQQFDGPAKAKGIQLKVNDESGGAHFLGDQVRIQQVVESLIENALKFTDKGEIATSITTINSVPNRTRILVAVQDSGMGISADKLKTVFEVFSQADDSSTRKFGGAGIGLSISRKFIELMNGQIGVESEVGKGSRFWFYLDLDNAPAIIDVGLKSSGRSNHQASA